MEKPVPFKVEVAEMIAYRVAYVYSNLECSTLIIGPVLTDSVSKNKKGKAVHITGEKLGAVRFTLNPSTNADSTENGLWPCANYHILIDKNGGIDYTESKLLEQKKEHEDSISVLLRTHKNPLPLISRQLTSREIAQNIVDYISSKGIYFQHSSTENSVSTINSIDQVRRMMQREMKSIGTDKHLKEICREIQDVNREFMNELSLDNSMFDAYLDILRKRTGRQLKRLRDEIGCDIVGQITIITP